MQLRIGIDAHAIGARKTGNETYTRELIQGLMDLPKNGHEFFVYVTDQSFASASQGHSDQVRFRRLAIRSPYLRFPVEFPVESRLRGLNVFHAQYFLPPLLPCRTVLTVHDIGFETYPELYDRKFLLLFKTLIPRSCARADRIIAVSEFTRQDLMRHYNIPAGKIAVIYNRIGAEYRPIDPEEGRAYVAAKYGIRLPYLLYVGNLQPRKNLPRLVKAFAGLRNVPPHQLVLVGQKAFQYDGIFRSVDEAGVSDRIVFPGFVPTSDLPYFYGGAAAFVYPSIFEGFGLPVVEAMACGAATITSLGSSLEEVAGDAADLVDPLDELQIRAAMERVLTDAAWRDGLRARGLRRAAIFSVLNLGAETVRVYEDAGGVRSAGARLRESV